MLNFGASKPRVKGGPGPQGPPGSAPVLFENECYIWVFLGFLEIVPKRTKDSWFSYNTVYIDRYVQVHDQLNNSLPFAQRNSRD